MKKSWSTKLLECKGKQKERQVKLDNLLESQNTFPNKSPFYRNNELYRAAFVPFEYTSDELSSISKIQKDPEYLLSLTKVLTPTLGYQTLVLRKYQSQALSNYNTQRFNAIVNSRQSGITTILALQALHYAYQSDKKILITSSNTANAEDTLSKVLMLYKNLPYYAKLGIKNVTQKKIEFDNGSFIKTGTFNGNAGSPFCMNFDFTLVDNFGHLIYSGANRFFSTYMPIVLARKTSKVTVVGIPNGDNHFKHFIHSDKYSRLFTKQHIPYHLVTNRDDVWVADAIRNIGSYGLFLQEYECIFIGTKEWTRINKLEELVN